MKSVEGFRNQLEEIVGSAFVLILAGAGIFLSVRLRFFPLVHCKAVWRETFGRLFHRADKAGKGSVSPFQATATALAGTLGTGNIVGVATALVSGGPGAVVWMGISSFFSMALKFAEIVLAVEYRTKDANGHWVGGPMYYLQNGVRSPLLAAVFSVLCASASFGIGNLAQSNAAAGAMKAAFGIPLPVTGAVTVLFVGLTFCGGLSWIGKVTERVVPVMAGIYLLASAAVLLFSAEKLPGIFVRMFREAFSLQAASGGILGFLIGRPVQVGVARGVFSNEAGMGSAPIVHGAAETDSSVRQGFWGVVEVFLDTTLMCTVTALVILSAGDLAGELRGAALTASAFERVLGRGAAGFVSVSIFAFAAASILGWSYYGEKAVAYLTTSVKALRIYRVAYLLAVFVGAMLSLEAVWAISDLLNLLMAIPNVAAVLLLQTVVVEKERNYFKLHKN